MSAHYAAGATAPATEQSTPAPVLVAFAGPAPQSRVTVAFRIVMAIPQLIVVWLLGVAAAITRLNTAAAIAIRRTQFVAPPTQCLPIGRRTICRPPP